MVSLVRGPGPATSIFFREACNKVLHADDVNFETPAEPPPVPSDMPEPLTGHLTLYGRLHGKEWRAELDLTQFALSSLALSP